MLCLLGAAGCLGATLAAAGFENGIRFFNSYIRWLFNKPLWQEAWVKGYEVIQVLLLVLFCYLLQAVTERDFRIKAAGAFVLLAVLVYCLLEQKEQEHSGIYALDDAVSSCLLSVVFLDAGTAEALRLAGV